MTKFKPTYALIILIISNLFLGFLIGNQYGQTWDEPSFYLYGERTYDAYLRGITGEPLNPEKNIYFLDLRYYGPVYTATGWRMVEALKPWLKTWGNIEIWHLINYCFFQIALVSLFFLSKRFVRPWIAFFIVLLFNTQPLIFGHAFINPKDIPFLTFFLASITAGLYMVDKIKETEDLGNQPFTLILYLSIIFAVYVFTFIGKDLISGLIGSVIAAFYNAPESSFLAKLFLLISGNSQPLPLENYIHKAVSAHLERLVLYGLLAFFLGKTFYWGYQNGELKKIFQKINFHLLVMVTFAAIILGLAISTRVIAPLAGILVTFYAVWEKKRFAISPLLYYFSLAGIITLLAWPFLWDSPSLHFLETFKVMRDFPFNAEVRFMGNNVPPSNLPWYYIPFLATVQLTEPTILFALSGFVVFLFGIRRKFEPEKLVLLLWLIVPIALQILFSSNVYDNFRQFLFILPPLFVFAGIGIEWIFSFLNKTLLRAMFLIAALAPGLYSLIALHPIQYIYYNTLVGGVAGAENNFELDYWLTSYREASAYINVHASPNANVLGWGSTFNGARDDLDVYAYMADDEVEKSDLKFEYAVITTRFFTNNASFPDAPVVYEVRRDGALLAVVKKLTK